MKLTILLLAVIAICLAAAVPTKDEQNIDRLFKLRKLYDLGLIDESEYNQRKNSVIDGYLGNSKKDLHKRWRIVKDDDKEWRMDVIMSPQVKWLLSIFENAMPRSYDDVLPATGKSYWVSEKYLAIGAINPVTGVVIPFDDDVAIQERALTHVGLNIYDGGVWSVALTLSGLADFVDIYYRNVLYVSTTGSNPFQDGISNIRGSSHARDYYYGAEKVSDKDLDKVRVPGNQTFVHLQDPTCCGTCCPVVADEEIPGGFFYRMIGPSYAMQDPLQGKYGWVWRAIPAGPNNDSTTEWNLAGIIHWNDWKPITGENVWAVILGPMQTMFIRNCTHVPTFSTYEDAPDEVQFAISILPACEALLSPLGSMYHCPEGTDMYPPDFDESTNVSNENNFSAYGAFRALDFILENFYTGGDAALDKAHKIAKKMLEGLDKWFSSTNLLPLPIVGEKVISQGGHVSFAGVYEPQDGPQAFAVDCQTWGLLNLGQKYFDGAHGLGRAYQVWQSTKKLSGYYLNGTDTLAGVGYTNGSTIWSGEWTWGAVFMLKRVGAEYIKAGQAAWGQEMINDAESMIREMKKEVVTDEDGVWVEGGLVQTDGSYLYANDRFFIPWGWYSNPIGATSSTGWAVFNDFEFNPFILGGGANTTFYDQQCKDNEPEQSILDALAKYYDY